MRAGEPGREIGLQKRSASTTNLLLRTSRDESSGSRLGYGEQSQHEELPRQCRRAVEDALNKIATIAWSSHCRSKFSEAISTARAISNAAMLAGYLESIEEERAAARQAAVWGSYLVKAEQSHSSERVFMSVTCGLARLRHLDCSAVDLLRAQYSFAQRGDEMEGKLAGLQSRLLQAVQV